MRRLTSKAELMKVLSASLAYCDSTYASTTDGNNLITLAEPSSQ